MVIDGLVSLTNSLGLIRLNPLPVLELIDHLAEVPIGVGIGLGLAGVGVNLLLEAGEDALDQVVAEEHDANHGDDGQQHRDERDVDDIGFQGAHDGLLAGDGASLGNDGWQHRNPLQISADAAVGRIDGEERPPAAVLDDTGMEGLAVDNDGLPCVEWQLPLG